MTELPFADDGGILVTLLDSSGQPLSFRDPLFIKIISLCQDDLCNLNLDRTKLVCSRLKEEYPVKVRPMPSHWRYVKERNAHIKKLEDSKNV